MYMEFACKLPKKLIVLKDDGIVFTQHRHDDKPSDLTDVQEFIPYGAIKKIENKSFSASIHVHYYTIKDGTKTKEKFSVCYGNDDYKLWADKAVEFAESRMKKAKKAEARPLTEEELEIYLQRREKAIARRDKKPEYTAKCESCGHIYHYTEEDLENSKRHKKRELTDSMIGAVGVLADEHALATRYAVTAHMHSSKYVDYNKCPKCGSVHIKDITFEEPDDAPPKKAELKEQHVSKSSINDIASDLKTLKELLDTGIITGEEFDAKKKQLLGL